MNRELLWEWGMIGSPGGRSILHYPFGCDILNNSGAESYMKLWKLTLPVLAVFLLLAGTALAEGSIAIDEAHFPDEAFRTCVTDFDTDGDGSLSPEEIEAVTEITCYCPDQMISSVAGVQYFTALEKFYCNYNLLTTLDLSANSTLERIECYGNLLGELIIGENSALKFLVCYGNRLTALDVAGCPSLVAINCSRNRLTALNVSANPKLHSLQATENSLETLDVSDNPELDYLHVGYNQLTALDVSANPVLDSLVCFHNGLKTLKLGTKPEMDSLSCQMNQLTTLDVSGCPRLRDLECYSNRLTALDFSENPELAFLDCRGNQLTSLNLIGADALNRLSCYSNPLKSFNISHNPYLIRACTGDGTAKEVSFQGETINIVTYGTNLESSFDPGVTFITADPSATFIGLDAAHFPDAHFRACVARCDIDGDGLLSNEERDLVKYIEVGEKEISDLAGIEYFSRIEGLECCGNQLTRLDLSDNPLLEDIDCSDNQLEALDLSALPALEYLTCSGNQLTRLDLSNNHEIWEVNCADNRLEALDLRGIPNLTMLRCQHNRIETLDISENDSLFMLNCADNLLKALPLENQVDLYSLHCEQNPLDALDVRGCPILMMALRPEKREEEDGTITYGELRFDADTVLNDGALPQFFRLPEDIRTIEAGAFAATAMEAIDLDDCEQLESIGSRAFANCGRLRYVGLNDWRLSIADDAFEGGDALYIVTGSEDIRDWAKAHDVKCAFIREELF